ncbi:MAG: hypothetical protein LBC85_04820 [Fibromonadaceae bacterium]|jgi:hypothetical protein|nr:hypothetical protein [Fibromonadaceae bacterium]
MKFLVPALLLCATLAFAQFDFDDDEWANFDFRHAGLTQIEFQNVKESGMGKEKLMYLLEIGIRPSTYLQEPWKNLGVSESEWLSQREKGMEDADIDRTYRNYGGDQSAAYLSFLIPSYYHWKTGDMAMAMAIDILWLTSVGVTVFLWNKGSTDNQWVYGAGAIGLVHIFSGATALLSTQWDNNPDARNFSWGILPTGKNSVAAAAAFRF